MSLIRLNLFLNSTYRVRYTFSRKIRKKNIKCYRCKQARDDKVNVLKKCTREEEKKTSTTTKPQQLV